MELISIGKFAKMVGVTPTTLRRMHDTGELIPYHTVSYTHLTLPTKRIV